MKRTRAGVADRVTIHAVGVDDVPAIAAFQTACWQQAYRGIVPDAFLDAMDLDARTAAWRERVESGRRQVAAAWRDGDVVGVVSWTADRSPGGIDELNTLYVSASRYGTGLGDVLLERALGTRAGRLWVFEANHRARRFYARHRFARTGAEQLDPGTGVWELELARPATAGPPAGSGSARSLR